MQLGPVSPPNYSDLHLNSNHGCARLHVFETNMALIPQASEMKSTHGLPLDISWPSLSPIVPAFNHLAVLGGSMRRTSREPGLGKLLRVRSMVARDAR